MLLGKACKEQEHMLLDAQGQPTFSAKGHMVKKVSASQATMQLLNPTTETQEQPRKYLSEWGGYIQ